MWIILLGVLSSHSLNLARAEATPGPRADQVFIAENKKTEHYIRDGLITGGDGAIDNVSIKDMRYSKNAKFERLVMELDVSKGLTPGVGVPRPAYYQVELTPELHRIIVTVFGQVKVGFSPLRVANSIKSSHFFERIQMMPPILKDRWSYVLYLKKPIAIEVFELNEPTRIILDSH